MRWSLSLGLYLTLSTSIAVAAPGTRLVPVFAEHVAGVNNSIWQSEVRFYNPTSLPQVVSVAKIFPYGSSVCTGFAAMTIPAGALAQLRSIGCTQGAAAVELSLDDRLVSDSVMTNIGQFPQDACCLSGYSQNIPVSAPVYAPMWTVANLQKPLSADRLSHLGRHNLGLLNAGDVAVDVTFRYFNAAGTEIDLPFLGVTHKSASVPAHTLIQVNDLLPFEQASITVPHESGYWRVLVTATGPINVYDSYVDNATNDATTIVAQPTQP